MAAFLVSHVVVALATGFAVVFATRVIAAVANAGFLAAALSVAGRLVPADRAARALAVLLSGTTMATVVGVPGGAVLGSLLGWRAAFWAVAVVCLPALLGVIRIHPSVTDHAAPVRLRSELAQLLGRRLVAVIVLAALANGATFATFTYLAPIVTDESRLPHRWVPVALMLFGVGSVAGVTMAGRYADRRPVLLIAVCAPLLLPGWLVLAGTAGHPAALLALAVVQGALSFALGCTLNACILRESAGASTMGGSYATAALNVGAALGPLGSSIVLDQEDPVRPVWVSATLVALVVALTIPLRDVLAPTHRPGGGAPGARSDDHAAAGPGGTPAAG